MSALRTYAASVIVFANLAMVSSVTVTLYRSPSHGKSGVPFPHTAIRTLTLEL